jgi:hypothetical protein
VSRRGSHIFSGFRWTVTRRPSCRTRPCGYPPEGFLGVWEKLHKNRRPPRASYPFCSAVTPVLPVTSSACLPGSPSPSWTGSATPLPDCAPPRQCSGQPPPAALLPVQLQRVPAPFPVPHLLPLSLLQQLAKGYVLRGQGHNGTCGRFGGCSYGPSRDGKPETPQHRPIMQRLKQAKQNKNLMQADKTAGEAQ